ncbi:MAG: hypothetical protein HQL94_06785 [Magnetococcales bacterium]|nr:hypothetical protein [Magnetococcales bacterium]
MSSERLFIASEVKELETLLSFIPEGNIIERMSLQSRLDTARETLSALSSQAPSEKVRLTFRGKPVIGNHGIAADFAAKAAGAFSDAFVAVAAGLSEGLRAMGPIPNRDRNQLVIIGTAIGSFGFEFELPTPSQPTLFPDEQAQDAMAKIQTLFRLAVEGSDDDVAEIIEEIHPRAVKKVYEFMDILVQQQAWCGLEFADRSFRYSGYEQLKRSCERLKDDNIQERKEAFLGEFQGVLPAGRTFEFKPFDQDGVIRGKIDPAIEDPDTLNRQWLRKPLKTIFDVMQVGQGRARYTLKSLDNLHQEKESDGVLFRS